MRDILAADFAMMQAPAGSHGVFAVVDWLGLHGESLFSENCYRLFPFLNCAGV